MSVTMTGITYRSLDGFLAVLFEVGRWGWPRGIMGRTSTTVFDWHASF